MLIDRVADLLREAATEAILPRFNRLRKGDVIEKSAGELVTSADEHSERIITEGLLALLPNSRVIGEEACAACPELLIRIDQGSTWLVDPLDGTGNFVGGRDRRSQSWQHFSRAEKRSRRGCSTRSPAESASPKRGPVPSSTGHASMPISEHHAGIG